MVNLELPEVVYHYTSVETLLKIVESLSIWATSIRYLNDISELEHYVSCVLRRQREYEKSYDWEKSDYYAPPVDFMALRRNDDREFYYLPFVSSFSGNADSLPQWRSYCPQGNGVSIGIYTSSLLKAAIAQGGHPVEKQVSANSSISFGRVTYLDVARDGGFLDDGINRARSRAYKAALEWAKDDPGDSEGIALTAAQYFGYEIRSEGVFVKHPSFNTEDEYRLVVTLPDEHTEYVRFRTTRSTLVPYVPLYIAGPSMSGYADESSPRFIKEIIVGPTTNPPLTMEAIKCFFLGKKANVEVRASQVPYRDW